MSSQSKSTELLFLAPNIDTFIKTDFEILSKHFDTAPLVWSGKVGILELSRRIRKTRCVLSWFAGDHSALASILCDFRGIPSVLLSGGVDVAAMPEINYGAMASNFRKRLPTKLALNFSTLILAFSAFSKSEIERIHHVRKLAVLYLGVDTRKFKPASQKEDIVLTVGQVSMGNLKRKGLQLFAEAARKLPQYHFVLAGKPLDNSFNSLKSKAPSNLTLPGFLSDDELAELYSKSKVYVQASAHEGFGVAVAEAMSSGCVPVVTDRGALPEVVGDVGITIDYGNIDALAEAINQTMSMPATEGQRARKRVIENFTLQTREEKFKEILKRLLEKG